jgi:hypothetical protein
MPITARYALRGADTGILAIAFPQVRVMKAPHFPEFIADERLVVVSDDEPFTKYPKKEITQITRNADLQLDTRNGFLHFLPTIGVKADDEQIEALLSMEESEFWIEAKLATILKYFPNLADGKIQKQSASLYRLFNALFEDFGEVYRQWNGLARTMSHTQMLSGLMTMTQKAIDGSFTGVSYGYRKVLEKNRPFCHKFNVLLLEYLRTRQDEWCFLGFLAECSDHTRPDLWPSR